MARSRVLVQYPPEVIAGIDKIAVSGKRTPLLVGLAEREIKLHNQREALREAAGCWKPDDHPELAGGAAAWVSKIRSRARQAGQAFDLPLNR